MSDFDPSDDHGKDAGPERRRPSRPSGVVDLGISVGIPLLTDILGGILGASGARRPERGEWQLVDERDRADADVSGDGTAETPASVADPREYLVDTRRTDDAVLVTAELPGVSEENLSVGIDDHSNDLVIAIDGRTVERISLPWSSTVAARVRFNNWILDVRLEPASGGTVNDDGEEAT